MISITLKDGSVLPIDNPTDCLGVAEKISPGLARAALAAKVDGEVCDLSRIIDKDVLLEILTFDSDEGRRAYWHTTSHILAQAVKRLYRDVKLAIGPSIENGFYYDFNTEEPFTAEALDRISGEMKKIIKEDHKIERFTMTRVL